VVVVAGGAAGGGCMHPEKPVCHPRTLCWLTPGFGTLSLWCTFPYPQQELAMFSP